MPSNADILHALLTTPRDQPMEVPQDVLPYWIRDIPLRAVYLQARSAYLARNPGLEMDFEDPEDGPDTAREHEAWLKEEFDPPVYSTDAETGEQLRIKREWLVEHGLLSNKPQKVYCMPTDLPSDQIGDWLFGRGEFADREKYAIWVDNDFNEYDLVDGQFIRKPKTDLSDD